MELLRREGFPEVRAIAGSYIHKTYKEIENV
jgi:hypothetical protein